jgi:uncharacterized protein (TIGR02246 family)
MKSTFGKRARVLVFMLLACVTAAGARAASADGAAEDEAAVRASVKQMEEGWNKKSGVLFARPFADDADYVVINGLHLRGRAAIEQGHQRIFDTIFKQSALSLTVKQVRFLRPDVAIVHVNAANQIPGREETRAVITLVMSKEKGVWQIAAFQNTQEASPGRP